ncbi:discoidin domain-containing protein [Amycolatopsis sp. lyj-346]|uniref:discoidin domain-containing protein n=1 Tax=Amycolatopsis sp. lyj-346 TaxID=2789289 RepID=UPI00397E3B69
MIAAAGLTIAAVPRATRRSPPSGRKAVTLSGQGQSIEFTLTAPANSIDFRYSVPDFASGSISLYVGGAHHRDIALTSKWAWYYGSYPFTNNPGDGRAHHFYDETRALLGTSYPAGTKIRLQVDAGDVTPVTVDLADFEQVGAAAPRPANSVSVTDYGATAGVFSFNTVLLPILANNIAVYGGHDNTVSDNVVADNQDQGGGLHIANRFGAVPLAGTTTVTRNTAIRTGVLDSNWQFGVGALWFDGRDSAITGRIDVTDNDLLDNNYEAIQFIDGATTDVHFDGVRITGAGTFAWQLQSKPSGSVKNVVATGIGQAGVNNCLGPDALGGLADQGGNSGWTTTYCGSWPAPVYGSDNGGPTTTPPPSGNLALHKTISASGAQGGFPPGNAVDGNPDSYWESTNNAFPQTLTVDLGAPSSITKVTLRLPPSPAWGTRTQTVTIAASTDGGSYTTLVGPRGYPFDPASGNTASASFAATSQRFVRLTFTGNTGWPAGQVSEFEVAAA